MTITTADAARRLGITQVAVRKLLQTGQLIQVGSAGRAILLDVHSVDQLARLGTRPGRPWTEANAWAAISLLSGVAKVDWVDPSELSRLRVKLDTIEPATLPILARKRAVVRRYRGTPDVVQRLHEHLALSGASAMSDDDVAVRFGLTHGAGLIDGYAKRGDADALSSAYGLLEDLDGNVVIREVTMGKPFRQGRVPLAAIALDLLESPATRERSAGHRVIEQLIKHGSGPNRQDEGDHQPVGALRQSGPTPAQPSRRLNIGLRPPS